MCTVHYYLLGSWYELPFADLASARAFACDFIAYYIVTSQGVVY